MYNNLHLAVLGGFSNNYYYGSSTDYNANAAWSQDFEDGYQFDDSKLDLPKIRAVRAF